MEQQAGWQQAEDGMAHVLAVLVVIVVVAIASVIVLGQLGDHRAGLDATALAGRASSGVASVSATGTDGVVHTGSGIVVRDDGTVVTTNHLIAGATRVSVRVGGNGATHTARVVGYDRGVDLAVLRLDGVSGATPLAFAPIPAASGTRVVAVGDALGLGGAPTGIAGTVTSTDRRVDDGGAINAVAVSIDVVIPAGDAGGPVLDRNGTVVALVMAPGAGTQFRPQPERATYALPIATVAAVVAEIATGNGGPGVHLGPSAQIAGVQTGPTSGHGAVVTARANAPASLARLQTGDTIVSIDDATIGGPADLDAALDAHRPGDTVTVSWLDAHNALESATVVLAAGPPR